MFRLLLLESMYNLLTKRHQEITKNIFKEHLLNCNNNLLNNEIKLNTKLRRRR